MNALEKLRDGSEVEYIKRLGFWNGIFTGFAFACIIISAWHVWCLCTAGQLGCHLALEHRARKIMRRYKRGTE